MNAATIFPLCLALVVLALVAVSGLIRWFATTRTAALLLSLAETTVCGIKWGAIILALAFVARVLVLVLIL